MLYISYIKRLKLLGDSGVLQYSMKDYFFRFGKGKLKIW